ncbi:MAG TPA: DUF4912 domain-containing protein [Dongiaceae bacterium]|nr:DUF4912 domain-containing protein [Dongiaceae bacterium]
MKKSRSGQAAETVPFPLSPQCSAQPESRERTVDEPPYPIPAILFEGDESDPPAPAVGSVEECAPSPVAQAGHVELEAADLPDESNTPRLAVGPVEERAPSKAAQAAPDELETTGLPEAYGTRTLLLTAQAPHWLYAHWDITREEQRQYSAPSEGRQLVLRVYERAVSGSPAAQIQVPPDSREWFAYVPRPGTQYVAELVCSSSGGLWQSLATSEVAVTPPDGVSQDHRVEFATIEPPTHQALPPRQDPAVPRAPLPPAGEAPAQSPFDEAPRPDLAEGVPQPQARLRPVPPPAAASQAGIFEQFVAKARPGQPEPSSAEIAQLLGARAEPETGFPAGGEELGLPSPVEAAAAITSPFGPPSITVASPDAGEESPEGFWLNVNAELVLYGATEPDAQVAIAGQPILLRPDGSFSYRFALPDGHYDLVVTAVSARKEQRSVRLQFSRRTD